LTLFKYSLKVYLNFIVRSERKSTAHIKNEHLNDEKIQVLAKFIFTFYFPVSMKD
jgi:hypothetical protein